MPNNRLDTLCNWLEGLPSSWKLDLSSLVPASADASFRRYFRLNSQNALYPTLIVMDAPPQSEPVEPFIAIAELLQHAGLHVPHVLEKNTADGFLLLSDLGSTTYLAALSDSNADALYSDAIDSLVAMQLASQPGMLPEYSEALLQRELDLLPEWYLKKHLQFELTADEEKYLRNAFALILKNNLAQPQVYVHRDFHSRNLMFTETKNPGILDFQDAVYGPITYDAASLWRDAYIEWPEERVIDWVARYWELGRKKGLPVDADFGQFYRDFEWMGLQRHIKVLGIFARLYHRDGKDGYLKDIPLVLKYALATANRYIELKPLARILERANGISSIK
jgi:aminoglycoside/choline kinase family phosphotransferase